MNDLSGWVLLILRIGILMALYGFLGWGLLFLWRDIDRQSRDSSTPFEQILKFIDEQDNEFVYKRNTILVGRDPHSDFHLSNDTVSLTHAKIYFKNTHWWVEDLQSRNGTFLNQVKVSTPVVLTNSDQIQFGELNFKISI